MTRIYNNYSNIIVTRDILCFSLKEYFKYLNNLFTIAFGENHGFNVKDVFDTEFEILKKF
jgi:hypothetical protein